MLREATEKKKGQGEGNQNLREVVGIKVGLEYIKEQHFVKLKSLRQKQRMYSRIKANCIFKQALVVMESQYFQWFIAGSIVFNTVLLSLDKYPTN